ncbi:hypothetical protein C4587_02940 [Candidatus Parcubacteria bacterium]|nr:MAG: hypothetical protein C4587_02940 [Candidatus Parcubacteria bacterium]
MISKKAVGAVIVFLIVLVGLAAFLLSKIRSGSGEARRSPYVAVYMASGDIYFGKAAWFPRFKLENVWYLQRGVNAQNQQELSVAPFSNVFWGPMNELYPNSEQVIFWTYLRSDSELAKALENPSSVGQQPLPSAPENVPVEEGTEDSQ